MTLSRSQCFEFEKKEEKKNEVKVLLYFLRTDVSNKESLISLDIMSIIKTSIDLRGLIPMYDV